MDEVFVVGPGQARIFLAPLRLGVNLLRRERFVSRKGAKAQRRKGLINLAHVKLLG
jgi:hypothetical protein